MIERGTATLGITVAAKFRRNRKITITTSPMVSISSNCTSSTDARMVTVRSVSVVISTAGGSEALSCGSSCLTRSTTSMMLAPGCRWMFTMTAGVVFIHAAWRTFSAASTTSATSDRCTGALLTYLITSGLYSALVRSWSLAPIVCACRGPSKLPLA